MELNLNERIVRISGGANLDRDLGELQDDVVIKIHGTIHGINPRPNYDGTFDKTFIVKMISAEIAEE